MHPAYITIMNLQLLAAKLATMRIFFSLFLLLVLVACTPQTNNNGLTIHDIALLGENGVIYSYAYGEAKSFRITQNIYSTRASTTSDISEDNFLQIRNALMINNQPYLRRAAPQMPAPIEVRRSRVSSDVLVRTNTSVQGVLYYDSERWFQLLGASRGRFDNEVIPRERLNALRGVGNLTTAEANALADYIEWLDEPVAIAVLPENAVRLNEIQGADDYKATILYVQRELPREIMSFSRAPQNVRWDVIGQGYDAVGIDSANFSVARSANRLLRLWNQGHGNQLHLPSVPVINFQQESVIAIYLGSKPTGGYSIDVNDVVIEDGEVYIDITIYEPSATDFTTQAFTSPWVMIRVSQANLELAWIRDSSSSRLLGVAR